MSVKAASRVKSNLKPVREIRVERAERAKLSAGESLRRTNDFDKRRNDFIAAIREGKRYLYDNYN